jgi:hypothetical protein
MIYRACQQFGCLPWQLSAKWLAVWNRYHGLRSRSRTLKRDWELQKRRFKAQQDKENE